MSNKNLDIENLFKLYYRPLCLYALHFVEDIDLAEDIVQDSFTDMWSQVNSGRNILNIKAYLYKIVKNRALAKIKQEKTVRLNTPMVDSIIDEEQLENNSFIEARLWNTIDSLPERCRLIFLMNKRDGMKYTEIAEELNISSKTVENQISKALKILKEGVKKIYNFFFG